jgi:hypothetical protein
MKIKEILNEDSGLIVRVDQPTNVQDFAEYVASLYRETPGNEDVTASDISLLMVPELMNQGTRVYGIQGREEGNQRFQIWGRILTSKTKIFRILNYFDKPGQQKALYDKLEASLFKKVVPGSKYKETLAEARRLHTESKERPSSAQVKSYNPQTRTEPQNCYACGKGIEGASVTVTILEKNISGRYHFHQDHV